MSKRQQEITEVLYRLYGLGFTSREADQLRGIALTLHSWAEKECNGEIERDETTNKPSRRVEYRSLSGAWKINHYPVADREAGALRSLAAIMANYPHLAFYQQGDPRGASLYLYRKDRLAAGQDIDSVYNSIGVAVY